MKFVLSLITFLFACQTLLCQIHVHDEKLHKLMLQNEYLNVMEIIAKPGEEALMHTHKHNYAYLSIKGGKLLLQDAGEEEREVNLPDHYAGGKYQNHIQPFTHKFTNIDDHDIHFIAVEHKKAFTLTKDLKINFHPDDILIDNQFFLVVKVLLQDMTSIAKEVPYPGVLINPNQKEVLSFDKDKHQKLPLWSYQEAGTKLMLSNKQKEDEVLYLFMTK